MSASATCVLMNGAVPIFADIDSNTFCIDSASVENRITKRTKAVMMVNLFGQTGDMSALIKVARKHHLAIIEDNAQSSGATWRSRYTGTVGDIGVFSFNVHKTMQAGEGGVRLSAESAWSGPMVLLFKAPAEPFRRVVVAGLEVELPPPKTEADKTH